MNLLHRDRWLSVVRPSSSALLILSVSCWLQSASLGGFPEVHDPRLSLSLIAEHPDIVTPIGMTIDRHDRLFVIESHTHHPPANYDGPTSDRIKILADVDGDGMFEHRAIFATGINAAMNLAFSPDGVLYVVCARQVLALHDENGDGVCERKERVLELVTTERYAHNCLLGITFDNDGWLYVARGNVASRKYSLQGTDGTQVNGYGDGGNIVRCRPDGSKVQEFATGFWNPFDLKFDHAGRLLCVDNDPDARGPNRLVHVVSGADFGYRSMYGGGGNHPFQGWDGDLPGTLPMISGTGEAPSGLLDCRRTALPYDFADSVLVTVWNENTIERHATRRNGVSLVAERSVLVSGDQQFRPVAIDTDSQGNIYFTDWVLVAYPNHGKGRIWKLSTKPNVSALTPRPRFVPYEGHPDQQQLEHVSQLDSLAEIRATLGSDDPFLKHAATNALASQLSETDLPALAEDSDADVRLASLIVAQRNGFKPVREVAKKLLSDPSERVRQAALIWVGQSMETSLEPDLGQAIRGLNVSGPLFETYIAAVENLDVDFVRQYESQADEKSNRLKRRTDDGLLRSIAKDNSHSTQVRSLALSRIEAPRDKPNYELLLALARHESQPLQLAAIRRLSLVAGSSVEPLLVSLASDRGLSSPVRAEALLALSHSPSLSPTKILPLLEENDRAVAAETARTLRHLKLGPSTVEMLKRKLEAALDIPAHTDLAEQLAYCLQLDTQPHRPTSLDDWQTAASSGGDPAAGRRVFYSIHATCSTCHTIGGRGGTLGPDLSNVSQSLSRSQIVHSILRPSDQFAPQHQAWLVVTIDGKVHMGLQLDHKSHGDIELYTTEGQTVHFNADEIEQYQTSRNSIMPNGLEANLGASEFRDLVAFLDTRR